MRKKHKKPNILFIMTDQQSATMMSCAGNKNLKTPSLDYIASKGMRFENAYCTNPVCVPSRFSLMSGRLPSEMAMRRNEDISRQVPENVCSTTLGTLMRDAGYETAYGGKIHLPGAISPKTKGFEYLCADERDSLAVECSKFIKKDHDNPFFLFASFVNPHDICYMAIKEFAQPERAKRTIERGSTEIATLDKALEIPRGISREEFIEKYCPELPPNFEPQENEPEIFLDFRMRRPFKQKAFENWSKEEWRFHRMAYCRLTELVDAQIGKLINALKESGQEDDTVVIFTSDHGDMDSAHRLEHKTYFYEEASRIPLLIACPGEIQPGSVSSALVSNGLDLMPTLCDYAGIPAPKYASGYSFRPLAENKKTKTRDYVFAESEIGNMARTEYYKYILYDSGKNREQLYDMRKDPFETRNAARDNGNEDILEEHRLIMKKELERQKKLIPESGRKDYYNLNA